MELKLSKGRYVYDENGALMELSGREEKIQRIMCRLAARRGGFYPMPDFGSRLHTLFSLKAPARPAAARQFVHEALEKESGVEVLRVDCGDGENGSLRIDIGLNIDGSDTELTFRV